MREGLFIVVGFPNKFLRSLEWGQHLNDRDFNLVVSSLFPTQGSLRRAESSAGFSPGDGRRAARPVQAGGRQRGP